MPSLFDQGFVVRYPAWHGLATVLQDFPGREEAMRLAGHDFEIIEGEVYTTDTSTPAEILGVPVISQLAPGYKALIKKQLRAPEDCDETNGKLLAIVRSTYGTVQNPTPWDIIDALVARPNVNYETGATLDDGAHCFVTAWVDEPVEIPGDPSPIYPYIAVNWRHDGLGAIKAIRTKVREVCANTVALAEAEASRTGMEFTFRHTRNVMDRIADAKMVLAGIGDSQTRFAELANELAELAINDNQRVAFVNQFIPTPPESLISERVRKNVAEARAKVTGLILTSPTVPDAHRDTGWGMFLAGTEYLDHLRGYRNTNTYLNRTLLTHETLKDALLPLIRECATL